MKPSARERSRSRGGCIGAGICATLLVAGAAHAAEKPGFPLKQHLDQHDINAGRYSFEQLYGWGGMMFSAPYNSLDGVGANLSQSPPGELVEMRFTRVPRADLPGWLENPRHPDGPQSQNCFECHNGSPNNTMIEDRDPRRTGDISQWIARKATDLSGMGALQLLAEQATREIRAIIDRAKGQAQTAGQPVTVDLLTSNRINYGTLKVLSDGTLDGSRVTGLHTTSFPVIFQMAYNVNPYHLKAVVPMARTFAAGTDTTLGLQSPERYPEWEDADHDGVVGELTVGDQTALTMFLAGQQRPVTKLELDKYLGGKHRLSNEEKAAIHRGKAKFSQIGCADCHTPRLHLKDATFREPSSTPGFAFPQFWINRIDPVTFEIHGTDPKPYGYDPAKPVTFSLTHNPVWQKTCNRLRMKERSFGRAGQDCFLQFESDGHGGAYIELYGDQRLHDMGPLLAEHIDEFPNVSKSVWRTKELWGVGSVNTWLHDGRATTLTEAILFHGGEGQAARDNFAGLSEREKDDVIAFLKNLVLFQPQFKKPDWQYDG